jgi:hypothetical protein
MSALFVISATTAHAWFVVMNNPMHCLFPVFSSIQALGWRARTLLGIQGARLLVMPQAV